MTDTGGVKKIIVIDDEEAIRQIFLKIRVLR
jgi:hypothetical protein